MIDLTQHWASIMALVVFVLAYGFVMAEEFLHLRKSKPVLVAAGVIWPLVAVAFISADLADEVPDLARHNMLEFAELMLFLLSAMTFVNTIDERGAFKALRGKLISQGYSLRRIFWLTGLLAFFISPIADNMTTALVMGAVVIAVGHGNARFIAPACISIVVAANAGGAFSPFGDITTLMVWQKGVITFFEFFALFIPALLNWLIPAALMSLSIPREQPQKLESNEGLKPGAVAIIALFIGTIAVTVSLHHFLHLPPFVGMMMGLGLLNIYGYFIRQQELKTWQDVVVPAGELKPARKPFDVFISMKRAEWDTLLFFYGIMMCVGGLGALGYLAALSGTLYGDWGASTANILIGLLSAVIDNIPVMFAVLSMNPDMSHGQWLLVTLTAGVGGSLLSIGSAAGVALMGQARGVYTFMAHLKWSWAVALGYAGSILAHFLINSRMFD